MALIETEGLTRVYNSGRPNQFAALRGVTLALERGERVAVVGRSGSGKSTLLHILGCLDRPTAGAYRLDGQEVPWQDERALARLRNRKIGFVFQEYALVPGQAAWENVALPLVHGGVPAVETRSRSLAALAAVGLADRAVQPVEALSGGQRQRVAIARAIVTGPDLVLADEPTGALDSETGVQVLDQLLVLADRGCAVVLVTHDPGRLCPALATGHDRHLLHLAVNLQRHRELMGAARAGCTTRMARAASPRKPSEHRSTVLTISLPKPSGKGFQRLPFRP